MKRLAALLGATLGIVLVLMILSASLVAQGCTQCRDNTAATPPETQHAYKTAIVLLMGTALGISSAVILIGRRFR